jgi:hypothetical protein
VFGVPLVEGVVEILCGVIHETARIVHPTCRTYKMVLGAPSGEECVVAHRLDHGSSQCLAKGSCAHQASESERASHCEMREEVVEGVRRRKKDLLDVRYCEVIPRGLYISPDYMRHGARMGKKARTQRIEFLQNRF